MHYPTLFLLFHHGFILVGQLLLVIVVVFAMVIYVWGMFGLRRNLILSDNWYFMK